MEKEKMFDKMVELETEAEQKYFKYNSISDQYDILMGEDFMEYKKLFKQYYGQPFKA